MFWPWSLLGHVHLNSGQKHKFRVANAETDLVLDLTQPWVMCTSTHGKAITWGWLLWVMTQKVGMTKSNVEKKRYNEQEKWLSQYCQLNIKKRQKECWTKIKRNKSDFHKRETKEKIRQRWQEKKRIINDERGRTFNCNVNDRNKSPKFTHIYYT